MNTDPKFYPEVLQVVAGNNYELFIYFNDGSIHFFDAGPTLAGAVFAPVRDRDVFRRTLTVLNGSVAWDIAGNRSESECLDLDPLELYRTTSEVDEPAFLRGSAEAAS